jgi:hypothetical protein
MLFETLVFFFNVAFPLLAKTTFSPPHYFVREGKGF